MKKPACGPSTVLMETQEKALPLGADAVRETDEKHSKVEYLLVTSALGTPRQRTDVRRVGLLQLWEVGLGCLDENVTFEQISEGGEAGVHAPMWEEGPCGGRVRSQRHDVGTDRLRVRAGNGTVGTNGAGPAGVGGTLTFIPFKGEARKGSKQRRDLVAGANFTSVISVSEPSLCLRSLVSLGLFLCPWVLAPTL